VILGLHIQGYVVMNLSKTKCLFSVMVVAAAVPNLALAQSSDALSGLYACETVADKNAQLACFLAETAKLRGTSPIVENHDVQNTVIASPKTEAAPGTGDWGVQKKARDSKEIKKRTLAIQSTTRGKVNNYVRFVLENGEVWQQTQPGRVRVGKTGKETLTIKKASFGSFLARVNDKGKSIRVKRVK